MSTEVKSHTKNFLTTRFFGGKTRGSCLQITDTQHKYIQVSKEEALALAQDLLAFANGNSDDELPQGIRQRDTIMQIGGY